MAMVELDSAAEALGARARAREALIGRSVANRYRIHRLLGHGGMGAVYEAEHLGLGKRVAIKFVDPEFAKDEQVVSRFAREARAMSSIESAHIVTVFDVGTEEGRPYLVMELLRGEDLGQRLRRARRIPLPDALHIIAQVLKGLVKAHAVGIVHRDLKPDNVFLVKSDTDPLFGKIVDFGVSKIDRPQDKTSPLALTGRGTVLGTPFYMCPEQAQAMPDVDGRADLYSVGAILFECLTGRPPHTGETYEQVILSICMRDAPDPRAIDPSIDPKVASFIGRALARERTNRYGSAERMLAALHEIAPEEKKRIPLDVAPKTLLSEGVASATNELSPSNNLRVGMETRLAGSLYGPPPDVPALVAKGAAETNGERTRRDGPAVPAPSEPAFPAPRRSTEETAPAPRLASSKGSPSPSKALAGVPSRHARSMTAAVATALVAMLMGGGVMLGIILAVGKKPEAATGAGDTTSTSATSATPRTTLSGIASGGTRGGTLTASGLPTFDAAAASSAPPKTPPSTASP